MTNQACAMFNASAPELSLEEVIPISSAIEELHSAFFTIIALKKTNNPVPKPRQPWHGISQEDAHPHEIEHTPITPHWTGSFDLLALPRELRDNIYTHYLHRQKALTWRRRPNHPHPHPHPHQTEENSTYSPNINQTTLNLFLVSRQIYAEAHYIFCRTNTILIQWCQGKCLECSLRLFPVHSAHMLQRIELRHRDFYPTPRGTWSEVVPSTTTWGEIARDAEIAKEYFPRLVTYTALWEIDRFGLYREKGLMTSQSDQAEFTTGFWLEWFRRRRDERGTVPPGWVRVKLWAATGSYHNWPGKEIDQGAVGEALELFHEENRKIR